MPELPDIALYIEHLERRVRGATLENVRLATPFLLRTVDPPIAAVRGKRVLGLSRIGKRIAFGLEGELFLVLHLMIAGRLRWHDRGAAPARPRRGARGLGTLPRPSTTAPGAAAPAPDAAASPALPPVPGKVGLAALDFSTGTLVLTEASTKKRASMHVVLGEGSVRALDPGGIEPLEADLAAFRTALTRENHTLKRSLTDPRLFSGIGNAYSDEILHRARLSPVRLTNRLDGEEIARLCEATRATLLTWLERLREETGEGFPEKVTAFRPDMAVHGKYGKPCPACGAPVQRIAYAENECNYCPTCQTGGKLLADRGLSRLLREDWPRTLDELENHKARRKAP